MDMETKLQSGNCTCPFNLALPQHPIISILIHNANIWNIILNHVRKLYQVEDKRFKAGLNELFRPVYLYILCDPHMKMPELCRVYVCLCSLLQFLLEEKSGCISLIPDIIGWLQISSIENQSVPTETIIALSKLELHKDVDIIILFLAKCIIVVQPRLYD